MSAQLATLDRIQQRVLWLATRMIHEANHVRPNPDTTKVGGHQASSASVVSILTALYFGGWLRAGDRVSVKPHASPVFHAIQYLLGNLDRRYLTDAARVRRPAGLSQPHQRPGPGRLLHRLGRPGRRRAAVRRAGRPLRRHPFPTGPGRPITPLRRARRRRRARRGQRLGSDQRRDDPRHAPGQRAVDRRPEPPEPGPRHPGHQGPGDGGAVSAASAGRSRSQVRPPPAGRVRQARRRGPAPAHRRHAQRGVPGPGPPARRRRARAADLRARPPSSGDDLARVVCRHRRTPTCRVCSATWAATTCGELLERLRRSRRQPPVGRPSCSPTR